MDIFDSRYYKTNRRLMKSIGQWPYQPRMQRWILSILLYIVVGTVTLVEGLKLVQLWGDIDLLVDSIIPFGVQIICYMKSSNCIINDVKMRRLLDTMKKDRANLTNEREMKILKSYAEKGYLLGLFYGGCILGSMMIYLILPLMPQILDVIAPINETRPRRLLYQTEYYVDQYDYYVSIMIHTYAGTILSIIIIISVDAMFLAYVHHVCGMITALGDRVKNTMQDADSAVIINRNIDEKYVYEYIANSIKDHGEVLEFARLIESSYSTTFLFQMGISMFLISATGLQVVSHLDSYDEVFRLGLFIIGQLFHVFINSWPGQMLIDHSQQFRDSLYFARWYKFSSREKDLLRLAMLRSLKPCKITAGKLYVMSMESFAKVVQTSMSYFTVLVSLR